MVSRGNKVAYIYDQEIGDFEFERGHVMKPHRIRMTNDIVREYGLYSHMDIYRPERATPREMTQFHTDEYIQYLQKLTPETVELFPQAQAVHELEEDCPVFEGLFEFCRISAGGSMDGARILGDGKHDIAINWAGGLHHAKKNMASGFCYVNDIVLAILDLLRKFKRVLYIDIDVHHGDGVEEAFYTTDRVMTASFHKFGGFPGTGHILDTGINNGMNYAVNVPLRDNIDDESYRSMFEPIIGTIMECYRPEAIVLQCGADSLSGDHIGAFNLSMEGHANCVKFVKGFNIPLLVLGGGGYTVPNVAKTWAYETGICVGVELDPEIPKKLELVTDYDQSDPPKWQGWKKESDYYNNFAPNYELDVRASNRLNHNSKQYLDRIRTIIIENIRRTKIHVPSVQMTDVPADTENLESALRDADEDEFPDERYTLYRQNKHIMEQDAELPDTDDEGDYPMMWKSKPPKCDPGQYGEEKAAEAKYISPYSTYKSGAESDEQHRVWLENVERDTAAKLLRNQEMSVGMSVRGMGGVSLAERVRGEMVKGVRISGEGV